ncbi:MAG: pesticin C-terminus-like muramidase [Raoultibacter sp.]
MSVITDFLTKWETVQLQGYIPCKKHNFTGLNKFSDCGPVIASSGVTIGTGVDLGQQSEDGLLGMGVPAVLIEKFAPYLGRSKIAAVEALQAAPIRITERECKQLNEAVRVAYVNQARRRFNEASSTSFDDIPEEAQAVIVSLGYQLGAPSKYPTTWKFLINCDWSGAVWELEHGFKNYANRRADEAALLRKIKR